MWYDVGYLRVTWQWTISPFHLCRKYIVKWSMFHCYLTLPGSNHHTSTASLTCHRWPLGRRTKPCHAPCCTLKEKTPQLPTTPPKFNIAPEKWWLEDEFPFWDCLFLGAMLNFRDVKVKGLDGHNSQGIRVGCWVFFQARLNQPLSRTN